MTRSPFAVSVSVLLVFITSYSQAKLGGVSVGQTRVIFSEEDKMNTVSINNNDNRAYLIQSQVKIATNTDNVKDVPFIVTPPLFTLKGNNKQLIRIIPLNNTLPNDRESLFHLTISAIPSEDNPITDHNKFSVGFQFVLKLFYRPSELSILPEDTPCNLNFSHKNNQLLIENPTPYYQTLGSLLLNNRSMPINGQPSMVAPYSSLNLAVSSSVSLINWQTVTDYGGLSDMCHQTLSD